MLVHLGHTEAGCLLRLVLVVHYSLKYTLPFHIDSMILVCIGTDLHGFEKRILPDINKRSSPGERWEQAEA